MSTNVITKICNKCNLGKELSEFYKGNKYKDGYRCECKECQKKYYENNPVKVKERTKKWRKDNPEKYKELGKKWQKDNPEKVIQNSKIWREANPKYIGIYLKKYRKDKPHMFVWRTILNNSLKRLGLPKENKTIDLLGYSATELKNHITSLFTEGMSWGNYGEWHIDHIKRVCEFDKETHPIIVNALSNLRPLWATTREINGVIYEGNLNRPKY